ALLAVIIVAAALAGRASSQDFPTRPIRIIIPYAAGGGSDITTRIVQGKAIELLGQSVIVDNRAGGGTLIGTRMVQAAAPDGYTLGVMDPAFIINPSLVRDAGYSVLKDFAPVTLMTATPLILAVTPSFPPKTVQELVDHARANPGKLNFGSPGDGSAGHLAIEQFRSVFKLNMMHIAYKGAGPAVTALAAGEIPMLLAGSGAVPFIQDGRLRGLAATSAKRLPSIPAVPTFTELGFPQVNVQTFAGLVAPAGTPRHAIRRLHAAFAGAVQTPEIKSRLEQLNQFPVGNTPEAFAVFLRDNGERLVNVVRDANIKTN
ncbi:MAG TPA: tripartite tricarboxylate transporter substrate binding protein, partial [Burkholderiales bacterium]|nr:tripartite tricarboxylate transporter substrate binding protein [Burkholderiales bacterium]